METTLVLIKPDAVRRQLMGQIITHLENKGLLIIGAKLLIMDDHLAGMHYAEHVGKPFFPELVDFITSGPLLALAVYGSRAVMAVRVLVGATDPLQAAPGTIRGDLGLDRTRNLVHASDSSEAAEREIALFFRPEELLARN